MMKAKFLAGFIIILACGLIVGFGKKEGPKEKVAQTSPQAKETKPQTEEEVGKEEEVVEEFLSPVKYGRDDPFAPITGEFEAEGESELEGILWDEKEPLAIIRGGRVVKVGDKINGGEIIKIEKDKVILREDGIEYELRLSGPRQIRR